MSRLSEISFEPLEPYDGKLSCTVLRGERGSNAPDLPDYFFYSRYAGIFENQFHNRAFFIVLRDGKFVVEISYRR